MELYLQQHPLLVGSMVGAILVCFLLIRRVKGKTRLQRDIASGKIMHSTEFEANWIIKGRKGVPEGYKYNDTPGCYVLTIYKKNFHVNKNNYMKFENVYVGQSVNICQRVHNHLNGKGNGDVYADMKYGKEVYVRLVPCKKTQMNRMEKDLIAAFNATSSYNETKGGGKKR